MEKVTKVLLIVRAIEVLFAGILIGVSIGGATKISEAPLNYMAFAGCWTFLALIVLTLDRFIHRIYSFVFQIALEGLTLLILIIAVIVVPAILFSQSSTSNNFCRIVLKDTSVVTHAAVVGCQCALTGAIFDGLLCICFIVSIIINIIEGRRIKNDMIF